MVTANKFKFKSSDSRITIPAWSYLNRASFSNSTNGSFYLPSTTSFEGLDINANTISDFSLTSGTHPLSDFSSHIDQDAIEYICNSKTIYQVRSNAWISVLDFQYPIGSFILMPYNISPTNLYGGNWVKITDYDGRYMSDCDSAALSKGGNNNVTFTPSLTCSAVTLTSSMAVPYPSCNPTFSISNNVYTHSHHPYNYTSMSETVYNDPGSGSTTTYYGSWNIHIASGDSYITARSVSSGSSNAWFLTAKDSGYGEQSAYLGANVAQKNNSHVHSVPTIAAANAIASHTHSVTNNTITVSVTPSSQPVVLWQRVS